MRWLREVYKGVMQRLWGGYKGVMIREAGLAAVGLTR
jgi:hypothetical protein